MRPVAPCGSWLLGRLELREAPLPDRQRWGGAGGDGVLRGQLGHRVARLPRAVGSGLAVDETIGALGGTFRYPFRYGYSCVGHVEEWRWSAAGVTSCSHSIPTRTVSWHAMPPGAASAGGPEVGHAVAASWRPRCSSRSTPGGARDTVVVDRARRRGAAHRGHVAAGRRARHRGRAAALAPAMSRPGSACRPSPRPMSPTSWPTPGTATGCRWWSRSPEPGGSRALPGLAALRRHGTGGIVVWHARMSSSRWATASTAAG